MEEFFEKLGKVTLGVVISGVAGLLMNILLGRFLSGAEYGTFRVFFSSVLMVGGFLSFGLERRTASLLAREDQDSEIASRMAGMVLIFISVLATSSLILWTYIETFLGGRTILISFVFSTALYILYKYSMGAFKGFRKEEFVGLQNIVIGLFKLAVIFLVFFMGYAATEISVLITLVYLSMVSVSAYWLRESLGKFRPSKPGLKDFKSVFLSNSKQIGALFVLQSAPLIVDVIGGATEAGVIGAAFTLSLIPYYAYRSLIHVILPEVSSLNSKGKNEEISSRIGILSWFTYALIGIWSFIGYFFGPKIVSLVYGSGFQILPFQGFLIFSTSSIFLLASLFTEVLISFGKEGSIAKAWIIPFISFGTIFLPYKNVITVTSATLFIYIVISTVILTVLVMSEGVKIWKLDLSQIPWKKLH
jgi:O-antigen/teichoic acid export membrane protein